MSEIHPLVEPIENNVETDKNKGYFKANRDTKADIVGKGFIIYGFVPLIAFILNLLFSNPLWKFLHPGSIILLGGTIGLFLQDYYKGQKENPSYAEYRIVGSFILIGLFETGYTVIKERLLAFTIPEINLETTTGVEQALDMFYQARTFINSNLIIMIVIGVPIVGFYLFTSNSFDTWVKRITYKDQHYIQIPTLFPVIVFLAISTGLGIILVALTGPMVDECISLLTKVQNNENIYHQDLQTLESQIKTIGLASLTIIGAAIAQMALQIRFGWRMAAVFKPKPMTTIHERNFIQKPTNEIHSDQTREISTLTSLDFRPYTSNEQITSLHRQLVNASKGLDQQNTEVDKWINWFINSTYEFNAEKISEATFFTMLQKYRAFVTKYTIFNNEKNTIERNTQMEGEK